MKNGEISSRVFAGLNFAVDIPFVFELKLFVFLAGKQFQAWAHILEIQRSQIGPPDSFPVKKVLKGSPFSFFFFPVTVYISYNLINLITRIIPL